MSHSLRNRRMSEFRPADPSTTAPTPAPAFNLSELTSHLPQSSSSAIPAHLASSSNTFPLTPSSSKPGVKRQQTYVRTADVVREKEKEKKKFGNIGGDSRKSRVGEKIKKRLSMRYAEPSPSIPAPPVPLLRTDPSLLTFPLDHPSSHDPSSSSFTNYSFPITSTLHPTSSSSLHRRSGGQEDVTGNREDELVRPRGMSGAVGGPGLGMGANGSDRVGGGWTMGDEQDGLGGGMGRGPRERWDLDGLKKDKVDVNTFIKNTLAGAEEDEVDDFKRALSGRKVSNANELKGNVFKNYAHFITIAKEIGLLENDMLELKDMLTEWKRTPGLLGGAGGGAGGAGDDLFGGYEVGKAVGSGMNVLERRKTVRNSVLDLENLYKTQIQSLWTKISGSQKFLPYSPGRHLICEASNFVELNSATYKAKQTVELFLLNDLLLVAVRKRKRNEMDAGGGSGKGKGGEGAREDEKQRGRLVAERCWNLNEVVVVDVKDSGDLTNAIKIRRGKESLVYRTNFADDKRILLGAFRKVAEDLAAKKRKESEKEQERRKSMWAGDMTNVKSGDAPPVPRMRLPTEEPDDEDDEWLATFEDDLTMAIAVRDGDQAVVLIKKGKSYLASAAGKSRQNNSWASRLDALEKELIAQVAYDLSNPDIKRSSCVKLVAYLVDLDHAQLASQKFLAARHELLQQRSRMISYLGDVPAYISELGVAMFTILKHTADWYLTAFRENRMISGLVEWAELEVRQFAETFRRQVYGPTADPVVVEESLRITSHHNRKLLRDSGLDFTFLLSTLLQPNWNDPDVKPNAIIGETELQKSARPPNARQETMERVAKAAQPVGGPPTAPPSPEMSSRPPRSEKRNRVPPSN